MDVLYNEMRGGISETCYIYTEFLREDSEFHEVFVTVHPLFTKG